MLEVVDRHFELGFDILAITDHVWRGPGGVRDLMNLVARCWTQTAWPDDRPGFPPVQLSHITQERLNEVLMGVGRGDRGMLMIPGTAELALGNTEEANVLFFDGNAPRAWAPPGDTLRGGIQIAYNDDALVFINHPGRTPLYGATAMSYPVGYIYSPNNPSNDSRRVQHFVNLFMEFPIASLVGMEVFNRRDGDSRHDRVLWDNILTQTIPAGRFVWGFANDDSHSNSPTSSSSIDTSRNIFLMPSNTLPNFRNAMVSGSFYMVTRVARNEGVGLGTDGQALTGVFPSISRITVDPAADTITIVAQNATRIVWISEGRTILETTGASSTIRLAHRDIIDNVGVYVRANIFNGTEGIALTQPIGIRRR